jgi:hypothetical protein
VSVKEAASRCGDNCEEPEFNTVPESRQKNFILAWEFGRCALSLTEKQKKAGRFQYATKGLFGMM